MKVVMVAIGTRGDVAPIAGLGMRLKEAGHDVAFATQVSFADLIRDCGLELRLIPGDTQTTLVSDVGRGWQHRGTMSLSGLRGAISLVTEMYRNLDAGIVEAAAGADVLLLGRIAFVHGYLVAKAMGIPSMGLELFPSGFAPTAEFMPASYGGRIAPRWLRRLMVAYNPIRQQLGSRLIRLKAFQDRLGLPAASARDILLEMPASNWPIYHGFSPVIVPRPADWRPGQEVVGYWWPPYPSTWQPRAELVDFLDAGPPPVYVGFGSMSPGAGEQLSTLVVSALRQAGVRGVIQAGWAGLAATGDDLLAIDEAPHEWLFPRMAAVCTTPAPAPLGPDFGPGCPRCRRRCSLISRSGWRDCGESASAPARCRTGS